MHIDIIVPLVVAVFGSTGFWSWVQSRGKKKSAEARLLLGIAYSEIIRRSEHYIHQGYIAVDEYNELNRYLYEPYRDFNKGVVASGGYSCAEDVRTGHDRVDRCRCSYI